MAGTSALDLMRRPSTPETSVYGRSVSPPFKYNDYRDPENKIRKSRTTSRETAKISRVHNISTSTHSSNVSTLLQEPFNTVLRENELRVTLVRGNSGYGFNIQGGVDQPHLVNDSGHFISKIRKGGAADKNGQLQVGDKIVSINGKSLLNFTHDEAIAIFHSSPYQVELIVQQNAEYHLKRQYNEDLEKEYKKNGLTLQKFTWFCANSALYLGFMPAIYLIKFIFYKNLIYKIHRCLGTTFYTSQKLFRRVVDYLFIRFVSKKTNCKQKSVQQANTGSDSD